jgi:glycosyltransferase involved in cell wall biosynthesis
MKRNVGLLIHTLSGGGAERVVSRLSSILVEQYNIYVILFEESIIKYDTSGTLVSLDVPTEKSMIRKVFLPFRRVAKLKRVKKNLNLEIVISFMDSPNLVNLLSKVPGCKTVVSIRNYVEIHHSSFLYRCIWPAVIKILYNRADCVIPVSKQIEYLLFKKYHILPEKMTTIYNPFDFDEIKRMACEPVEKDFIEFISKGKTFIGIGRRTYQKGFWHLIKAFSLVYDKESDTRLVIIGKDEMDGKLEKLVNVLNLNESVLIMSFCDNPFKYMANSDVYVLSSLHEGFPNAMVEAMACGCAVVAADCKSGPREILYSQPDITAECEGIEYAQYGILTKCFTSDTDWDENFIEESERQMAEAMLQLIQSNKMLEEYSMKATERAMDFSYDACRSKFRSIIEKKKD